MIPKKGTAKFLEDHQISFEIRFENLNKGKVIIEGKGKLSLNKLNTLTIISCSNIICNFYVQYIDSLFYLSGCKICSVFFKFRFLLSMPEKMPEIFETIYQTQL